MVYIISNHVAYFNQKEPDTMSKIQDLKSHNIVYIARASAHAHASAPHIRLPTRMHTRAPTHPRTHARMHTHARTHVSTHLHPHERKLARTYCTRMHAHMPHRHTHTHPPHTHTLDRPMQTHKGRLIGLCWCITCTGQERGILHYEGA